MRVIRSKAPLRLGLAGGGTDVSPFCDHYGGQVLNATINLYSHCTIIPQDDGTVSFCRTDINNSERVLAEPQLKLEGNNVLARAVYNRIVSDFNGGSCISHRIITSTDAPPGSGLGSSSASIVAMIQAYAELLNIPFGEYDTASLAYRIERQDVGQQGGHQDQYAAAFGGINFMEFGGNHRVLVNPLRVKDWIVAELESSMILYYTSQSRISSEIIADQVQRIEDNDPVALKATLELKEDALAMKEALLTGKIRKLGDILGKSWIAKKKIAESINSETLEGAMEVALSAGAYSGKVSGAGGGGFMMFIMDPLKKPKVQAALNSLPRGYCVPFQFVPHGVQSWTISAQWGDVAIL